MQKVLRNAPAAAWSWSSRPRTLRVIALRPPIELDEQSCAT